MESFNQIILKENKYIKQKVYRDKKNHVVTSSKQKILIFLAVVGYQVIQ